MFSIFLFRQSFAEVSKRFTVFQTNKDLHPNGDTVTAMLSAVQFYYRDCANLLVFGGFKNSDLSTFGVYVDFCYALHDF